MIGGAEENGGLVGLFRRMIWRTERDRVCPFGVGFRGEARTDRSEPEIVWGLMSVSQAKNVRSGCKTEGIPTTVHPKLSQMALDFLCIPPTSTAVERVFSQG